MIKLWLEEDEEIQRVNRHPRRKAFPANLLNAAVAGKLWLLSVLPEEFSSIPVCVWRGIGLKAEI